MKYSGCENCPRFGGPGPYDLGRQHLHRTPFVVITDGIPTQGEERIINGIMYGAGYKDHTTLPIVRCVGDPENAADAALHCSQHLIKDLQTSGPRAIMLAGDLAISTLLDNYSTWHPDYKPSTMRKGKPTPVAAAMRYGCPEWRYGSVFLPMPAPMALQQNPTLKFQSRVWIKKLGTLKHIPPKFSFILEPTDAEVRDYNDAIRQTNNFSADVETFFVGETEFEDEDKKRVDANAQYSLTMLGVGANPNEALVMSPQQVPLIAPAYSLESAIRYEHNGNYDQYFLEPFFPQHVNRVHDCIFSFHLIYNYCFKALKPHGISMFTLLPYYNHDLAYQVNMKFYNACDIVTTLAEGRVLEVHLLRNNLDKLFYETCMPLLRELENWRRIGMNIDIRKAEKFRAIIEEKLVFAQKFFDKATGNKFMMTSPQQLKELFYDILGLPPQHGTKMADRKKLMIDFEARKRLHWHVNQELEGSGFMSREELSRLAIAKTALTMVDLAAGEKKKLEYLDRIEADGKIHPTFIPYRQEFFRLASYPNVQNIPTEDIDKWGGARNVDQSGRPIPTSTESLGSLRSLVIPDNPEEDLLVSVDFAQMQLWIYAAQFNVKWLLEIKEKGEYLYGTIYEELYGPFFQEGKPRTKKFKRPNISKSGLRIAKAVPLGFIFNRSAEAVAVEQGWPLSKAEALRRWFFGKCPELETSYQRIREEVKRGYIRHAFGQICWFPDFKVTEAINSYAQSPEAIIVWKAIVQNAAKFKELAPFCRQVLSVHDSLLINVSGAQKHPERIKILHDEILTPILSQRLPELNNISLAFEASVGTMWDWEDEDYEDWIVRQSCA